MSAVEGDATSSVCALSAQPKPVRLHRLWTDYALLIYVLENFLDVESCEPEGTSQRQGARIWRKIVSCLYMLSKWRKNTPNRQKQKWGLGWQRF